MQTKCKSYANEGVYSQYRHKLHYVLHIKPGGRADADGSGALKVRNVKNGATLEFAFIRNMAMPLPVT